MTRETPLRAGFARFVALAMAMAVAAFGLTPLALSGPAAGAEGDVGTRGFRYGSPVSTSNPNDAPTASKPQSKLWYVESTNTWWGVLLNNAKDAHHIYRFDAARDEWVDTGTLVDSREKARVDVLWDGRHVYVVSARTSRTAADAIQFRRFTYDDSTGTYTRDAALDDTLNTIGVEAAVIAKDSTGRLWVTYTNVRSLTDGTNTHEVRVVVGSNLGESWGNPMALPGIPESTGLADDDISSVVAHGGKISVVWSKQDPTRPTGPSESAFYVAEHADSEPAGTGWILQNIAKGIDLADDHVNLSVDGDGAGRVFLVVKTGADHNEPIDPAAALVQLWVLENGLWSHYTHSTVADDMTRPIVVVDRDNGLLRVFATHTTDGGPIYEKTVPLAGPYNFQAGKGTPFITLASDTHTNNATTTKQNVTRGSGLLVLASDQATGFYAHNSASVPVPDPTASFTAEPVNGVYPLEVAFANTSTSATGYSWDFGDGEKSALASPGSHTYDEPGEYTVTLTATNRSGASSTATATVTVHYPDLTADFSASAGGSLAPTTLAFKDSSSGDPTEWSWSFGDGGTSTEQNPRHEYPRAGDYEVTLTASNPEKSATVTKTVTVARASGPTVTMSSPSRTYTTGRWVGAAWKASSTGLPAVSYEVRRSEATQEAGFTSYQPWRTDTTSTSAGFRGAPGETYCFKARGTDRFGTTGPWSAVRCTAVPLDERSMAVAGSWRKAASAGSYLGTVMRSTAKGSALSEVVSAKRIGLIVTKAPGGGKVAVYRGRTLVKRISLASDSVRKRVFVPVASYERQTRASFRVVVLSSGRQVVVDGLAVSRR